MNIYPYLIKHAMPNLSPTAWKVLCCVLETPDASYTVITKAAGAGVKSTATIRRALDELVSGEYITARSPSKWEPTTYAIHGRLSALVSKVETTLETKAPASVCEAESPKSPTLDSKVLIGNLNIKPLGGGVPPAPDLTSHPAVAYWRTTFQQQLIPGFKQALAGCTNMPALEKTAADYLAQPRWNPTNQEAVLDRYAKYARAPIDHTASRASDLAALEAEVAALHRRKAEETDFQARRALTDAIQEKTRTLIHRKNQQAPQRGTVAA